MTPNERKALDFIRAYAAEHGYGPTLDEVAKAIGYANKSTVHGLVGNLVADGALEHRPLRTRGYMVPETKEQLADRIVEALKLGADGLSTDYLECSVAEARSIILRELVG